MSIKPIPPAFLAGGCLGEGKATSMKPYLIELEIAGDTAMWTRENMEIKRLKDF